MNEYTRNNVRNRKLQHRHVGGLSLQQYEADYFGRLHSVWKTLSSPLKSSACMERGAQTPLTMVEHLGEDAGSLRIQ